MHKHHYSWLALGDSYTIGEGLPLHQSFPYQALHLLRTKGLRVHAPEIVAQTGWTSFELAEHLIHHPVSEHYDGVTLLIGVNNQYRGLALADFENEFDFLLKKGLHYAGQQHERVLVLSIPDWGVTPFAADRDPKAIAAEIDGFNAALAGVCQRYNIAFADITTAQRATGHLPQMLAADGLHPSGLGYAEWAVVVADFFEVCWG